MYDNDGNLKGKLLVATPFVTNESMFFRSVIYVLSNDITGAIGVVVNSAIPDVNSELIFNAFKLQVEHKQGFNMPIHIGGPIESERGFILHTSEYSHDIMIKTEDLSFSSSLDILSNIASGKGPRKSIFVLGYFNWNPGKLEQEVKDSNWFVIPYSEDLVFGSNNYKKWYTALNKVGITSTVVGDQIGHA
jgi:putative transcriptional regulator